MFSECIDLVLFDVKHLDAGEHKKATGVENGLILKNLERACERTKVWLRIPLIAGFNDSPAHVAEIARLGKAMNVDKISILPYHEGGRTKCDQMGRRYKYRERSGSDRGADPEAPGDYRRAWRQGIHRNVSQLRLTSFAGTPFRVQGVRSIW